MKTEAKKKNKLKIILKVIHKKVKLRYIFILTVLLASNTFAWFVYNTQVNNSIDVHVRAWKITLKQADTPITDYVNFDVDNIYPGMEDYTNSLKIYNESELSAYFKYSLLSANILGTTYTTVEGRQDAKELPVATDLTSDELIALLENDYPFKITFDLTDDVLEAESGESVYGIRVEWDYESGDDELDTQFGTLAYSYMQNNPGGKCIEIKVKIEVGQKNE